jgi:hypothetical protein
MKRRGMRNLSDVCRILQLKRSVISDRDFLKTVEGGSKRFLALLGMTTQVGDQSGKEEAVRWANRLLFPPPN